MIIYSQEIADGVSELIRTSAKVSIASIAEPANKDQKNTIRQQKSIASYADEDLYYVQSILVTSSWNKNDDIFTKEEVWAARDTPEDKPTNLEHDENTIIGHIISNWPIDNDGKPIDINTPVQSLPEKFHIVTGSVIYRAYTQPDLQERTAKLISSIENGTKYVSMECMFKGFDYGLINKSTNEYKTLSRSDQTAFLTKHLRAYGGSGQYENYKIGRVLRNITFSGKGYVDKPANPDSIIFTNENFKTLLNTEIAKNNISGVSQISTNVMETNKMNQEEQVVETVASESVDNTAAMEATIKTHEETIATLSTELNNVRAELSSLLAATALEKEVAAKKTEEDKMKEEEMKKMKASLEEAQNTIAEMTAREALMLKKQKSVKRMATLVEAGVDSELASSTVEQFADLNDETFSSITSLVVAKMPDWLKKKKEEEKKAQSSDVEQVLDNAEPVEGDLDLSVGGDSNTTEVHTTRAALVDFVCNRLGTKLNKGE
jgi:hypothetical protein